MRRRDQQGSSREKDVEIEMEEKGRPSHSRSALTKSMSVPSEHLHSTTPHERKRMGTQEGLERIRPPLAKVQSIKEVLPRFVGLAQPDNEDASDEWNNRRLNYINRHFKLSKKTYGEFGERQLGTSPAIATTTGTARVSFGLPPSERSLEMRPRSDSIEAVVRQRRDSVFRILADNAGSLFTKGRLMPSSLTAKARSHKTLRTSFQVDPSDEEGEEPVPFTPGRPILTGLSPAVTSSVLSTRDFSVVTPTDKRKTVADKYRSTLTKLAETDEQETMETSVAEERESGAFPPSTLAPRSPTESLPFELARPNELPMGRAPLARRQSTVREEVFFDLGTPASVPVLSSPPPPLTAHAAALPLAPPQARAAERHIAGRDVSRRRNELFALELGSSVLNYPTGAPVALAPQYAKEGQIEPERPPHHREARPQFTRKRAERERSGEDGVIARVSELIATSDQHRIRRGGEGALGRLLRRKMKPATASLIPPSDYPTHLARKLNRTFNERPLFTYWVTSVQVIVCIFSILLYGIGPFSLARTHHSGEVLSLDDTLITVGFYEQGNLWIGPKFADLIRLGAKYSPCMRRERKVVEQLEEDRKAESRTGCCVDSQGSCYQASKETCPSAHSTLYRHSRTHRPHSSSLSKPQQPSDVVCGLHPDYCDEPPSIAPVEWPNDITKWPSCRRERSLSNAPSYMTCRVVGHPCCIHLQGRCRITTQHYCDFVGGFYHPNKTLCSQVHCLGSVCGMLPFLDESKPDQFYRLFLALFLHAGLVVAEIGRVEKEWLLSVLHLALTLAVQWVFMRDLEYYIGWVRMAIIYCVAGVGGNLASAIFVPFNPEVGPSGSQAGIVGALLIDVFYNQDKIERPLKAYGETLGWIAVLLLSGLLPWNDNWAHLFGVIFGILTALLVFPDAGSTYGKRHRVITVTIAGGLSTSIFFILAVLFFNNIEIECEWCGNFNCVNFYRIWRYLSRETESEAAHFCDNQGLRLDSWLPI